MTLDEATPLALEAPLPGLAPIATTKERIRALLDIGLTMAELAEAVGVSEATLRNWSEQATAPRQAAARALDDLRTAVVALHEAGIEREHAVQWLTSRQLNRWLKGQRPVDTLRKDPLLVLAALEDLLTPAPDRDAAKVTYLDVSPQRAPATAARSGARRRSRRQSSGAH